MHEYFMARTRVYVVFKGRQPEIFFSWPECQEQVNGFKNNLYQSYATIEKAEIAFVDYVERCLHQPFETSPVHESIVLRRAYFNNECINSFMLGCAVGIIIMSVFTFWLYLYIIQTKSNIYVNYCER